MFLKGLLPAFEKLGKLKEIAEYLSGFETETYRTGV